MNNAEINIENILAKIGILEKSRHNDQTAYNKCVQTIERYQTELAKAVQQTVSTKAEIAHITTLLNEKKWSGKNFARLRGFSPP